MLFLVVCCGIIAGTFTGLIPGVHINLIASILLVNFAIISIYFDVQLICVFIVVMSVVHTFIDFIPSILFGVPNADTALSVLPAHKLVLDGKGYKAIFLSSIGSLFGIFFSILMVPLFFWGLNGFYEFVKVYVPYVLIVTVVLLIFFETTWNKKFWAIIIVLFSGGFGMFVLNCTLVDDSMLVLFTGLFGISGIFYSIKDDNDSFPKQTFDVNFKFSWDFFKAIFVGGLAASICSVTAGIGNAQAGTLAAVFFRKITSELFIVVLSAINTINFVLSIVTFYLIGRARNGSIFVVSQIVQMISFDDFLLFFGIVFGVSFIGFFLTLFLGRRLINFICRVNVKLVNVCILLFLFLVVFVLSGFYGILIMIASSCLGVLCVALEVRRVHLMSVLIIPVVVNLM